MCNKIYYTSLSGNLWMKYKPISVNHQQLWRWVRNASFNSDVLIWRQLITSTSTWYENSNFLRKFLRDGLYGHRVNWWQWSLITWCFVIVSFIFSISIWYKNDDMAFFKSHLVLTLCRCISDLESDSSGLIYSNLGLICDAI